MRDASLLAFHIQALAGVLALGCTRGDPQANVQPDPTTAKTSTTTTTTAATADPPPDPTTAPTPTAPPDMPHFSCPSEAWCGTAAEVSALATKSEGSKMACPVQLVNEAGGTVMPRVKGYWYNGNLDEDATKAARSSGTANACCYNLGHPCGGGRPLMDEGRAVVASTRVRADWIASDVAPQLLDALDEETRRALGEAWLSDARVEHASIASFSRVSMELVAIGAPSELVEAAHRAALDEVRHARICFALAGAYLRRDVGPDRLPVLSPRPCTLADVAADAFLEGCVGESVSALVAIRAAERCDDVAVKRLLEEMARDEESHAALAFRTVAWCIDAGGDDVRARIAALLARPPSDRFQAAKTDLSAFGRLDERAIADAVRDAWQAIVEPTTRAWV